ncbi:Sec1-like protein [Piedraia hortae CBS 480.64]|uniref:Sec1-like protein n=1 Tax=Piedraia hortae CBS 480.64 TaxID=1314780 RepID=A0A6A7CA04_9PEZI|nr:Sec1-like protein [Piedraia hortae CBS 480.64]
MDSAVSRVLAVIEAARGKKNLVIQQSLAGTLGLLVKFSTLQDHGVDKLFFLENHNVDTSQKNIIFFARGENAKTVRTIAEQIRMVRTASQISHEFTIVWVPRRTRVSDLVLEEHGVLGETSITSIPLHFIPLEQDLLSLELESSFHDLCLWKDPTCVFAAAQALMELQKQKGMFPRILGKGDGAKRLANLLQRMRSEEEVDASSSLHSDSFGLTPSAEWENLIIIDRETDFPSALATQLTYKGLLDEVFGVAHNQIEVDSSVLEGASPKRKIQLDNNSKLFPDIRNVNFATIGPSLNRVARRLASEQDNIKSKDQSIADLRANVAKLPGYQAEQAALKTHTALAESITTFTKSETFSNTLEVEQTLLIGSDPNTIHDNIEELIAREAPLKTVLRLLCLESCLANGFRQRDLENFKRQVLLAYGFQHLITLANLGKMGLLVSREAHKGFLNPIAGSAGQTTTDWAAIRRSLSLWVDDINESDPQDVAYVFSGYAPLSVRLVQCVLQKSYLQGLLNPPKNAPASGAPVTTSGSGWKGFEDSLGRMRGATVDVTQAGANEDASAVRSALRKEGPKTTVVFYLGGVTWAEVAALRYVSSQIEAASGRKIVIATTSMINGNEIVDAALQKGGFASN